MSSEQLRKAFVRAFLPIQLFPDVVSFDPSDLGWDGLFFPDHEFGVCDISLHELDVIVASSEKPDTNETADGLLEKLAALANRKSGCS